MRRWKPSGLFPSTVLQLQLIDFNRPASPAQQALNPAPDPDYGPGLEPLLLWLPVVQLSLSGAPLSRYLVEVGDRGEEEGLQAVTQDKPRPCRARHTRRLHARRGVGRQRQGSPSAWFKPTLVLPRPGPRHRIPGSPGQPRRGS